MKGFVQVLTLILILGGIGLGAYYLPTLRTTLSPKAASIGINILESKEASLKLRLIAPWPPLPNSNSKEDLKSEDVIKRRGSIKIAGKFVDNKGNPIIGAKITDICKGKSALEKIVRYKENNFEFNLNRGESFCIKPGSLKGYKAILAQSAKLKDSKTYEWQVAGISCSLNQEGCNDGGRLLDLDNDEKFNFVFVEDSVSLNEREEFTLLALIAEDPNFSHNIFSVNPYTFNPQTLDYSLSDSSEGVKTVYVKFISSLGGERVYLASIDFKNTPKEIVETFPLETKAPSINAKPEVSSAPSPTPSSSAGPTPTPTPKANPPNIALNPSSGTFNKNCKFNIILEVNTGDKKSDGVDVILKYDPHILSISSVNKGNLFPTYPPPILESGRIVYSGLPSINKPFSGEGVFANIEFLVKQDAPGEKTEIKLEFDSNDKLKLTDTNILETTSFKDVLNSVVDGSYSISNGSCN